MKVLAWIAILSLAVCMTLWLGDALAQMPDPHGVLPWQSKAEWVDGVYVFRDHPRPIPASIVQWSQIADSSPMVMSTKDARVITLRGYSCAQNGNKTICTPSKKARQ
jgi:hypothetical protein